MAIRKKTTKQQATVIYWGPSMKSVLQYSTFRNGLPPALKDLTKQHKWFKGMLVPPAKLSEVMKSMKEQGSREHTLYKKALEAIKEGGK